MKNFVFQFCNCYIQILYTAFYVPYTKRYNPNFHYFQHRTFLKAQVASILISKNLINVGMSFYLPLLLFYKDEKKYSARFIKRRDEITKGKRVLFVAFFLYLLGSEKFEANFLCKR